MIFRLLYMGGAVALALGYDKYCEVRANKLINAADDMSDEELLENMKKLDDLQVERIMKEHYGRLYKYARIVAKQRGLR